MGPLSRARARHAASCSALVLLLWLAANGIGISATTVALLGVAMLLLTRVLDWQDILEEKGAWDALIWFGGLVMLAGQLDKAGLSAGVRARRRRARSAAGRGGGRWSRCSSSISMRTTRSRAWSRT